ncbi:hypothetical protein BD310DRAFT_440458, partial [Dichomitus squalens]
NRQVHKLRQLAADAALRASVSSSVGPSPKRRASSDDPRLNGFVLVSCAYRIRRSCIVQSRHPRNVCVVRPRMIASLTCMRTTPRRLPHQAYLPRRI